VCHCPPLFAEANRSLIRCISPGTFIPKINPIAADLHIKSMISL
jgi:hypothetical protein